MGNRIWQGGGRLVIVAGRLDEEKATERRREKESVKMQTEQRLHADILTLTWCRSKVSVFWYLNTKCVNMTASC